ncbi:hypothetical protein PG985_010630 [Apiospora marii]|uniref:Uncharacterized protein n=1 Tax=Apiospora marii TaxID=335849 RepID=A0ABR1T390_9PEZI
MPIRSPSSSLERTSLTKPSCCVHSNLPLGFQQQVAQTRLLSLKVGASPDFFSYVASSCRVALGSLFNLTLHANFVPTCAWQRAPPPRFDAIQISNARKETRPRESGRILLYITLPRDAYYPTPPQYNVDCPIEDARHDIQSRFVYQIASCASICSEWSCWRNAFTLQTSPTEPMALGAGEEGGETNMFTTRTNGGEMEERHPPDHQSPTSPPSRSS